jgi:hypothetical protein
MNRVIVVGLRRVTLLGAAAMLSAIGATAAAAAPRPMPAKPVSPDRGVQRVIAQPAPPVTAADFRIEPEGRAPRDNDGLIPNRLTPTGSPVAPPSACTYTFESTHGATSASVNAWVSANENTITVPTVLCLAGVFTRPLHVWSKTTTPLLEIAPAPHEAATLDLGAVQPADSNPNQYWSDSGGISIVDSRSVEIYGLTVENYTFDGTSQVPAGIYVTTRSDTTATKGPPHLSACFQHGGACSDIYVIKDKVLDITNRADESHTSKPFCNNADVDAYGIAVIAAGTATSPQLQHVVVEDDTVAGTRTGQSETMTFNGALRDFLVAGNVVDDADNIGIDTIGWETGEARANHGYVGHNTVYNVDTFSNAAYGHWDAAKRTCEALPENAAGLYDDGASYIWFGSNTVWNTDQGINLDVETPGKETDHLLVSANVVHDDPGTSKSDPSRGTNPPGQAGTSTVAGHDAYAMYVDAFAPKARIFDVYVHDNVFENESQHYLRPSDAMPVVDLGGLWSRVEIWHNTIEGLGRGDLYNPLMEVDNFPAAGAIDSIDCNEYENLSIATDTVNGNFATPSASYIRLTGWRLGNGHDWDAHSEVGSYSASCPAASVP